MTFNNIKIQIGKTIKYYTDAGGWLTGRDVTEDDIGEFVNQIYREDLFAMFATQYPYYFRQVATADSWIATGTVDATSTGSTLVATTSIFNNSMEGLWVYNEDLDETGIISDYVSGTTVTLEGTIGDTWDGDTIYVLGQEFAIGGDAADIFVIENVGLKYQTTDTYFYLTGNPRPKFDIFQYGGETFSQGAPQLYLTTTLVNNVPTDTLGVLPQFTTLVPQAIEINYIAKPVALSGDNDVPRLPVNTDVALIYGGSARAFRQSQQFDKANQMDALYEKAKREAVARFRPTSTDTPRRGRLPRVVRSMHRRFV